MAFTFLDYLRNQCINGELLDFTIFDTYKNVFLSKDDDRFQVSYSYSFKNLDIDIFIKYNETGQIELSKTNDENNSFKEFNVELFKSYFGDLIRKLMKDSEPIVSFWEPSEKYLISSDINLNAFRNDINSNLPLKNIFALSGFTTDEIIHEKITEITNSQKRSRLEALLSDKTTQYITKIWKHKIGFVIDISETGNCSISIKDDGINNKYDRHAMSVRSEGFKQFISLILSLSIDTKSKSEFKKIILIDEPENHLHPSGIRDLSKELLEIGKNNFLFVSTLSPFLIDKKNKERHFIIKKDANAHTVKKEIKGYDDLRDDEVLSQAFGINIYTDLLNTKKLLVEGASDKKILAKAFSIEKLDYGIKNGHGSNIVQIASRLNDDDIEIFVLVDDDTAGKKDKEQILKIEGVYNLDNTFTIKDLVADITNEGTIEDCLGKGYVQSQLNLLYVEEYKKECNLELNENSPFIEQIKIYLLKNKILKKDLDNFFEKLKIEISENIECKNNYGTKFPLLKQLVQAISSKL